MSLLIDGYNLIFQTNFFGSGNDPRSLERSRKRLLDFLVNSFDEATRQRTTVVFDAKNAPHGLPRCEHYHGITVHFASEYDNADAMIGDLLRHDSAPRQMTVVSSDHEVQKAAKRRRAKFIDSEAWYERVLRERAEPPAAPEDLTRSHGPLLTPEEISSLAKEMAEEQREDIFPPGYAEDLFDEEDP